MYVSGLGQSASAADACKADSDWCYSACMWSTDWNACSKKCEPEHAGCLQKAGFTAADARAIASSWRVAADAKRLAAKAAIDHATAIAVTTQQPAMIAVPPGLPPPPNPTVSPASAVATQTSAPADRSGSVVAGLIAVGVVGTVAYFVMRRR